MVKIVILQELQIATVLLCAPFLRGIINRLKAIVQSRRGPSVWQPYRDLWKLLRKGSVISEHASWVFHADRKSTRLNSSHRTISYAVFCLKKKKKNKNTIYNKKKKKIKKIIITKYKLF